MYSFIVVVHIISCCSGKRWQRILQKTKFFLNLISCEIGTKAKCRFIIEMGADILDTFPII